MAASEERGGGASGGGIHIRNVQGAFAVGDNNRVVNQQSAAGRDPAQEELLRAVLELRADLARFVQSDETAALDAELEGAQDEIERTGQAGPGRLARLRQALTDAGTVTGLVASAATVGQAVGALLGG